MRAIFNRATPPSSCCPSPPEIGRFVAADKAFPKRIRCARNLLPAGAVFHISNSKGDESAVQVIVRDNNVDQALKALKKKMQREGIFREMKLRRSYEKPSERRAREKAEAVRRARKIERKRLEREGF
jgi:small subunit ribosomal protein S21